MKMSVAVLVCILLNLWLASAFETAPDLDSKKPKVVVKEEIFGNGKIVAVPFCGVIVP